MLVSFKQDHPTEFSYVITRFATTRFSFVLYGGKIIAGEGNILRSIGLEVEVFIFHLMDVNRVGPRLLGVFDGGRLEEYMEGSKNPSDEYIANQEIMDCLARKLAKMHSVKVPINKKPKDYINIIRQKFDQHWPDYLVSLKEHKFPEGSPENHKTLAKIAIDYNFNEMIDWYEKTLPSIKTRIVFSHNDMNRSNCFINPNRTEDDRVTLMDFEFSGYNYRGFDIGRHFRMRMRENVKLPERDPSLFGPSFPYPSEEERRLFIRGYLKGAKNHYEDFDEILDNEDNILIEAEFFGGLHSLFLQAYMMSIPGLLKKMNIPIHPAVPIGMMISEFEERKQRIKFT